MAGRAASRRLASPGVPTDPAHDQRLAEGVNVAVFEQALTRWITDVQGELPDREGPLPIAVDGKSLRGSWGRFGQARSSANGHRVRRDASELV